MNENYFQYLPVSESNMEWDLYLTGTGVTQIAPDEDYPPPRHPGTYNFKWETGRVLPEYQVVFIVEGQGMFESADMGTVEAKSLGETHPDEAFHGLLARGLSLG